jgi:hypothetical protein
MKAHFKAPTKSVQGMFCCQASAWQLGLSQCKWGSKPPHGVCKDHFSSDIKLILSDTYEIKGFIIHLGTRERKHNMPHDRPYGRSFHRAGSTKQVGSQESVDLWSSVFIGDKSGIHKQKM